MENSSVPKINLEDLKATQKKGVSIYAMLYALPVLRSPARRDVGGCALRFALYFSSP